MTVSHLPRLFRSLIAWSALSLSASLAHAQLQWDLPSAYPEASFHTRNLLQFASDVKRTTQGRLQINVHPNATLFKAPEIKRAVQGGQAQIGEVLLVNHQNEWQIFGVDGIPFLAQSYGASLKLYQAQRSALEKKLAESGLLLLYAVAWPPQGIFSNRPLTHAADLRGMKWRAYSPATSRLAELLDARPVTVQAAELTQAMAAGVVESFMSSGSTGYDAKAHEHLKYFYDIQAWLPKNAVLVNQAAFSSLDASLQNALRQAASAAETRGWAMSREENSHALDELRKRGMQVLPASAQLKSSLERVGDMMLHEWMQKAGPDGRSIVSEFKRL